MVARLLVAAAALALLFPVCVCKDDLHVGHQPPPGVLNPSEEDFNDESLDVLRREEHPWAGRDPSVEALLRGEPPLRGEAPEVRSAAVRQDPAMKFLRVRDTGSDKLLAMIAARKESKKQRDASDASTPHESEHEPPVEPGSAAPPTPEEIKTSFEMVFEMIYGVGGKVRLRYLSSSPLIAPLVPRHPSPLLRL